MPKSKTPHADALAKLRLKLAKLNEQRRAVLNAELAIFNKAHGTSFEISATNGWYNDVNTATDWLTKLDKAIDKIALDNDEKAKEEQLQNNLRWQEFCLKLLAVGDGHGKVVKLPSRYEFGG